MDQRLLTPLSALETSLNALVHSLTSTTTFIGAPKAARDLVAADDTLTDALIELKRHQDNYVEILNLRSEKERLQKRLRQTVLTCRDLRDEIGRIHPSILDDTDDEEDEQPTSVDYETLLAFATRIGKHNVVARQLAEKEAQRSYVEAKKKRYEDQQPTLITITTENDTLKTNGHHIVEQPNRVPNGPPVDTRTPGQTVQTQEAAARIDTIRDIQSQARAYSTAPYPASEYLRLGELGKLQIERENNGEEFVDAAVEAMVRDSELGGQARQGFSVPVSGSVPEPENLSQDDRPTRPRESGEQPTTQHQAVTVPAPAPRREAQPRPQIDLDFPEEEDDEEDG